METDKELNVTGFELDDDETAFAVGGINAMPESKRCSNPACRMYGKTKAYPPHTAVCRYCGQKTLTDKYSGYDKTGRTE